MKAHSACQSYSNPRQAEESVTSVTASHAPLSQSSHRPHQIKELSHTINIAYACRVIRFEVDRNRAFIKAWRVASR